MADTFWQWLSAMKDANQHSSNAGAARDARAQHILDRSRGVERVIDHHLERIQQREINLHGFCQIVADSPALNKDQQP